MLNPRPEIEQTAASPRADHHRNIFDTVPNRNTPCRGLASCPLPRKVGSGTKLGWSAAGDEGETPREIGLVIEAGLKDHITQTSIGRTQQRHCPIDLDPQHILLRADAVCVPFNLEIPTYDEIPRDFDGLSRFLVEIESHYSEGNLAEGVVFHHPDGRRAKIKRRDFANL